MFFNRPLAFALAAALLAGCGATAPPQPRIDDARTLSYASPQECYAAMLKAAETEDGPAFLSCLAVADRNQQLGWLAFHVEREAFFQTEKHDDARELLRKHGLEGADIIGLMQVYDSPSGKGVAKAVELVGAEIKDQPTFFAEARALLNLVPDASHTDQAAAPQTRAVLSEVRIQGSQARGVVVHPASGEPAPIFFVREKNSWVITFEPLKLELQ